MPILAAEPILYPESLLDEAADNARDTDRLWWVVYTKSRQEKSLARQLLGMQVPFYLPLVPKVSMIRGRRMKSMIPVFGSYLFLFGNEEERVKALTTERIVQLLPVPRADEMRRDLRHVAQLIETKMPLTVEARLSPGQRIRVTSGSLMGLEGDIISRRGEDRLLVGVKFLQQGVSVLIQDFLVEPV